MNYLQAHSCAAFAHSVPAYITYCYGRNKNSQRIMWSIQYAGYSFHLLLVPQHTIFSSINFPSKISCNICLHGIRCNLLTSDASITRKVVW